jgi:hypothetical protein
MVCVHGDMLSIRTWDLGHQHASVQKLIQLLDKWTEKRLIKLLDYPLQFILHNTHRYEHEKQHNVWHAFSFPSLLLTCTLTDHNSAHRKLR